MEPVGPFKTFPPPPQPLRLRLKNYAVAGALFSLVAYTYAYSVWKMMPKGLDGARPSAPRDQ
jgi:hypothetical protein